MSQQINTKWLAPMPRWYQHFSDREFDLIADAFEPDTGLPMLTCGVCGVEYQPRSAYSNRRKVCYDPECRAEKRRLSRLGTPLQVQVPPKTCAICEAEFTPNALAQHQIICGSPACYRERKARNSRAQYARTKARVA